MESAAESIKLSFKQLLKTKPYGKITISEICKDAGVSRRTFYKHYESIDEIVTAQIRGDFVVPVQELRSLLPMSEIKSASILMLEMQYNILLNNRDFYLKVIDYRGKMSLVETIIEQVQPLNTAIYATYNLLPEEQEFAAYYFAASSAVMIAWWLQNKPDLSPKQMAKYMNTWSFAHWREIEDRF